MGERGPLPKAVVRRRNKRPEARAGLYQSRPVMPRTLVGEARAEWRRIIPQLEAMGALSSLDRGTLARYCSAWADWVELNKLAEGMQAIIRGRDGQLTRNPVWRARRDADTQLTTLAAQLGLSPMSRLRAGIKHEREGVVEEVPEGVTAIDDFRERMNAEAAESR